MQTAYILQAVVMLAVAAGVIRVWWQGGPLAERGSVLVLGLLLFTPHAFPYDLALLALPLAWLGWEAYTKGCQPWEQVLLVLGWLLPLVCVFLSILKVQLAPLVLAALFVIAVNKTNRSVLQSNFSTALGSDSHGS